jgi:hypothetical protein
MIAFLSGAVALGYLVVGVCFLRFWRQTKDSLFVSFAVAFWLFALNQMLAAAWGTNDERTGFVYVLRALGFIVILVAIVRKNASSRGSK